MTTPRTRRILLLASLLIDLPILAFLLLALWPFPPDGPPPGVVSNAPGDGGLRRPFPAMAVRPGNEITPERVALGRLLYFDPILSGGNDVSCATCHHPDLGLADGRGLSMGKGGTGVGPERSGGTVVRRSAPTVWNAAYNHRQFWDGRASDLEDQARFPITSADEMAQDPDELVRELASVPEYVRLFDAAYGGEDGSAVTFANTAGAVAAFERTLVSDASPFDRYRMGDTTALGPAERRGLTLFRSLKTRCFECHGFPTLANPDFKVIGVPDLAGQANDRGRAEAGGGPAYERAFKVPTLRNVALTAPYMHNGRFRTLEEVLAFYAKGGGKGEGLELPNLDDKIRVFSLSTSEQRDLLAFLGALTDETRRPEVPDEVPSGLSVVARRAASPARGRSDPRARTAAVIPSSRPALTHTVKPGGSIQDAVDAARPGDTIEVEPGSYRQSVLVDVDRVTLRGLVRDGRRAVLDGQGALTDAVIASGHGFTIEGFALRDYTSNGITVHGATGVVFRDLVVENTGLYGVYPVECRDVLVEKVLVTGAKDAAIYVGQSADIVVRGNEVRGNVTGIEIENSTNALVEDNYAHDNTGGILVFLLPNNPSKVGNDTRVVRNRVIANNHPNFGDPSAIVSKVPPGSGIFIMAADGTEVAENEIRGNDSFGVAVVSLAMAFPPGATFDVGPVPEGNWIHDNVLADNGRNPAPSVKEVTGGGVDLLWDGSGWTNAWRQPGASRFPPLLPDRTWPDLVRKAWSRAVSGLARMLG
jgi:parallel beta-helix repeat protein